MATSATSLTVKFDNSTERNSTTFADMLHAVDEGIMSARTSVAKSRERQSNVIAFPQGPRLRVAFRCEDTARAAICSHCGGLLAEGESEDECSSVRVSRSS